jgi:hypothetical protein
MTGNDHEIGGYPETENWQKALGKHNIWGSAKVSRAGNEVTMKVTVNAADLYDFNAADNKDIRSGLSDAENGRFAELGWAKQFKTHGSVTFTKGWTVAN